MTYDSFTQDLIERIEKNPPKSTWRREPTLTNFVIHRSWSDFDDFTGFHIDTAITAPDESELRRLYVKAIGEDNQTKILLFSLEGRDYLRWQYWKDGRERSMKLIPMK